MLLNASQQLSSEPVDERVAALLALDGHRLGGVTLRVRDWNKQAQWLDKLQSLSWPSPATPAKSKGAQHVRLGVKTDLEHVLGGLDIGASLQHGAPVQRIGLAVRADHGTITLPSFSRQSPSLLHSISTLLDRGMISNRGFENVSETPDQLSCVDHSLARVCVVAIDDRIDTAESTSTAMLALLDRMAFTLDLTSPVDECLPEELFNTASSKPRVVAPIMQPQALRQARKHLSQTIMPRSAIVSICEAAVDMSISSVRASVLCARACRGLAALNHREEVSTEDVDTAINLVLSWRAAPTAEQLNSSSESTQAANDQQSEQPSQTTSAQATTPDKSTVPEVDQSDTNASAADGGRLEEQTVEITRSELPEGLLGTIAQVPGKTDNTNRGQQGRVGVAQQSSQRGRPIGAQRGRPEGHKKIHIHATLRAAVPWQRARRRSHQQHQEARHLIVMPEDLHIARYSVVRRNVTIFVVDASGSAAAQRLSEAKGAVELLLAECYVRRDEVSLIVYQGAAARVVLPPTRSLARARRELANLPGGGGTPLASALTLAADVAQRVVQNGSTPLLCVLTDGRANVDRAGIGGRERAEQHALLAASELGQLGVRTLVIDFALRPRALSKQLAANAKGTMLALPRADAASIHNALANGSR